MIPNLWHVAVLRGAESAEKGSVLRIDNDMGVDDHTMLTMSAEVSALAFPAEISKRCYLDLAEYQH